MESLQRLEGKLDRLVDAVASIDKMLAVQATKLASLEEAVNDLKPIKDQVQRVKGMSLLIGFLVTAAETVRHFIVKG